MWRKVRPFGAVRTWRLFRWIKQITALVIIKLLSTHTIYEYKRTNCFSFHSLRKHPFLLALRSWGRFARNVSSGEERGETDVFAGYSFHYWVTLDYFWRFTLLFGWQIKLERSRRLQSPLGFNFTFLTSIKPSMGNYPDTTKAPATFLESRKLAQIQH